uniref:BAG domain-containing protein n=1 Tax=Panagrellus redivivus TaxID=6233 RepID=A0A7E4V2R0_PANRE
MFNSRFDDKMDNNTNNTRLPRATFADDPFFSSHDPFEDFHRSPQPARRFGSASRLIDDGWDDFGKQFQSLPRQQFARQASRSPRPPTDRGHFQGERTIPVQRANGPARNVSPNPNGEQFYQQQHHNQYAAPQQPQQGQGQQPQAKKSPVPKGAVEINNATSSYTNGALNPDRQQVHRQDSGNSTEQPRSRSESVRSRPSQPPSPPASSSPKNVTVKVETVPAERPKTPEIDTTVEEPAAVKVIEVPITASGPSVAARRSAFLDKKASLDAGCSEQLITLLDEAERRVEQLRQMAAQMEEEKETLMSTLGQVKINAEIMRLGQGDRDDIDAHADRILKRVKAVQVTVSTPRNEEQAKALDDVNRLIDTVTAKMMDDLVATQNTIERYLNACSPEETGPIDQKFQAMIIECTADDQKKIRRKLAQIIEQIKHAQLVCSAPDYN